MSRRLQRLIGTVVALLGFAGIAWEAFGQLNRIDVTLFAVVLFCGVVILMAANPPRR